MLFSGKCNIFAVYNKSGLQNHGTTNYTISNKQQAKMHKKAETIKVTTTLENRPQMI